MTTFIGAIVHPGHLRRNNYLNFVTVVITYLRGYDSTHGQAIFNSKSDY
jgi:hypothetical protein